MTETISTLICYTSIIFMTYYFFKLHKLQKADEYDSKEFKSAFISYMFFQAIAYLNSVYTLWYVSFYPNFIDFVKNDFVIPLFFLIGLLSLDYDIIRSKNMRL